MSQVERKLFKVAKHYNISKEEIVEYLKAKGFEGVQSKPNFELTDDMLEAVAGHFAKEAKHAERIRSKLEQYEKHRSPSKKEHAPTHQPVADAEVEAMQLEPISDVPDGGEATSISQQDIILANQEVPATVADESQESAEINTEIASSLSSESAELYLQFAGKQEAVEEITSTASSSAITSPSLESIEPRSQETEQQEQLIAITQPESSPGSEIAIKTDTTDTEFQDKEQTETIEAGQEPDSTAVYSTHTEEEKSLASLSTEQSPNKEVAEEKTRPRVLNVIFTSEPDTPSTSWKLRGLTVVGKIELPVEEPRRGKRTPPKKGDKTQQTTGKSSSPTKKETRAEQRTKEKTKSSPSPSIAKPLESRPLSIDQPKVIPVSLYPSISKTKDKRSSNKEDIFLADDKAPTKRKSHRPNKAEQDIDRAIRETLAGLDEEARIKSKIKQKKKQQREERQQRQLEELLKQKGKLQVTEFVTVEELASLLGVSASEIIQKCLGLGLMVSINQRLGRDVIQLIASDYGIEVEFLTDKEIILEEETAADPPEMLVPRPPIVTIMGHVDHGKTSLLDYIRNSNIVAGEAGGITQHIGAYKVSLPNGKSITFLDTPGHEAFTAMRARGAQVTDIVVLVVAADDSVMPQTVEAISHAKAAGVPIVVAINKIDKDTANPDRIKQQLAEHGVLVEEWGGKYQCAEISAKKGINVDLLLEKILLEAELLELKANPNRPAIGTVIEAHVDKGRGNVATILVQNGTLRKGDTFVCGQYFGRVRAMYDERGNRVDEAPPSTPVQVTGFEGLPEAGDKLVVSNDEDKLRHIAQQRQILRREQQLRQSKRVSLDELSRQIKQGEKKELRIILKADVSGSLEALSDALSRLNTDEVTVSIIHRAVGNISESDVMLAAASDAVIIGFQVQLPASVRRIAEQEQVDVRLYSIIYDAINEVKLALEGMLSPETTEEIVGRAEVRQIFRISKIGTVAGCYVISGLITRNDKVRIIRDGFEIYRGTIQSLKHLKEDVREIRQGFECGLTVSGFNDYVEGDIIEAFRITEVQRKLSQ
ncbi:MAG: translation initiation factor IF-2 [Bacteroidota bacterium]|nr:translation initiation factor IF-2 [Candidatus Kapabacteria bacterium]MCX7937377.1 translation initiation factor IF-2 [Chlorobiota bacterium]MDW8074498.1 translation initiation factor IF-2 [Bacteroidota bacterium]MDW8271026.1 translation initiation factor IF-2 [Bacteroidota bacterium]